MSYEGYEQWLCRQGHLEVFDCYMTPEESTWKCPTCGEGLAFAHSVDETNGEGRPMKFEVDVPAEVCTCEKCGNQHRTTVTRYKIPTGRRRR